MHVEAGAGVKAYRLHNGVATCPANNNDITIAVLAAVLLFGNVEICDSNDPTCQGMCTCLSREL